MQTVISAGKTLHAPPFEASWNQGDHVKSNWGRISSQLLKYCLLPELSVLKIMSNPGRRVSIIEDGMKLFINFVAIAGLIGLAQAFGVGPWQTLTKLSQANTATTNPTTADISSSVSAISSNTEVTYAAQVTRVIDGSTIEVADDQNRKIIIRIDSIACPAPDQPYSRVAKQALSDLVLGQYVSVHRTAIDREGTTWASVQIGEQDVSEMMIYNGHAWHDTAYSNSERLAALEQYARENRLGLWADRLAIAPWEWRNGQSQLR